MDNLLKTSADDLYELVKEKKKISVDEAAKALRLPVNVVQSLVDFLVEEKLFGIEYKFTTPYIYISQNNPKEKSGELSFSKGIFTKEEFFERAKSTKMPFEKINEMWKRYIDGNISNLKEEFYSKARKRSLGKEKTDFLWGKYLTYLR